MRRCVRTVGAKVEIGMPFVGRRPYDAERTVTALRVQRLGAPGGL